MSQQLEPFELLRKKFCPPLDEALFQALASDYDLENEKSKQELELTLQSLQENAAIEQDLELLEPMKKSMSNHDNDQISSRNEQGSSVTIESRPHTSNTDGVMNDITASFAQLQPYEAKSSHGYSDSSTADFGSEAQEMQRGSMEDQRDWLKNMFPFVHEIQVNESLTKSRGNLEAAIDELLNLSFIHEDIESSQRVTKPILKSIDGFAEVDNTQRKRKGKSRNNRNRAGFVDHDYSDETISSGTSTPATNVWKSVSSDVEFLTSRIDRSPAMLKSAYHEHTTNLPRTIRALVEKEARTYGKSNSEDVNVQLQIEELRPEFPSLPDAQLYAALALTRFIPTTAKEVLETMLNPVLRPARDDTTLLLPSYTPINLSDNEEDARSKLRSTAASTKLGDPTILAQRAGEHGLAAQRAVNQASSAFRRGKSNHLYGGAAAYYASVYHENRKNQKELLSSASDSLVAQQSSGNSLDLHGVTVEHAKRIACEKVEAWWESLGDRKFMYAGVGEGFRIITGVGSHSSQGIAKIGPAVTKALMKEGWRLNVQRGEIFVEGRR